MKRLYCPCTIALLAIISISGCGGIGGNVNDGASPEEIQNYKELYQRELDAQAELEAFASDSGDAE